MKYDPPWSFEILIPCFKCNCNCRVFNALSSMAESGCAAGCAVWAPYGGGLPRQRVAAHSVDCSSITAIFALGCNVAVREAQLRRHYCYLKTKSKPRSPSSEWWCQFLEPSGHQHSYRKHTGNTEHRHADTYILLLYGHSGS